MLVLIGKFGLHCAYVLCPKSDCLGSFVSPNCFHTGVLYDGIDTSSFHSIFHGLSLHHYSSLITTSVSLVRMFMSPFCKNSRPQQVANMFRNGESGNTDFRTPVADKGGCWNDGFRKFYIGQIEIRCEARFVSGLWQVSYILTLCRSVSSGILVFLVGKRHWVWMALARVWHPKIFGVNKSRIFGDLNFELSPTGINMITAE